MRASKFYPVPPVCTAYWTHEDWERTARYRITEPDVKSALGLWWIRTETRVQEGARDVAMYETSRSFHSRLLPQTTQTRTC